MLSAADMVVTMGCGDECPYAPGRRYEDWPIADAARAGPSQVAAIRDDIDARVQALVAANLIDNPQVPVSGVAPAAGAAP